MKTSTSSSVVVTGNRNGMSLPFLMRYGTWFHKRFRQISCSLRWTINSILIAWKKKGERLFFSKNGSSVLHCYLSAAGGTNLRLGLSCNLLHVIYKFHKMYSFDILMKFLLIARFSLYLSRIMWMWMFSLKPVNLYFIYLNCISWWMFWLKMWLLIIVMIWQTNVEFEST